MLCIGAVLAGLALSISIGLLRLYCYDYFSYDLRANYLPPPRSMGESHLY